MPPATRNVTPGPSAPVNPNATMSSNASATSALSSHANIVSKKERHHQTPKRGGSELFEREGDRKKPKMDLRTVVGGINESQQTDREQKERTRKRRRRKKKNLFADSVQQHHERHYSVSTLSGVPGAESATQSTVASIRETASAVEMTSEDEQPTYSSSDKGKGKARLAASPGRSARGSPTQRQLAASGSPSRNATELEVSSSSSNTNDNPESSTHSSEMALLKAQLAEQRKLLEKHHKHLHQQQQALTCQICLDLMHRPYALAPCGHVTCYGCLVRWFTALQNQNEAFDGGQQQEAEGEAASYGDDVGQILNSAAARRGTFVRRRKTCPICRAAVSARPVEMWEIKNMVSALLRSHLLDLPQGPSARDNQGANVNGNHNDPWRNIFRCLSAQPGLPANAINQEEDRNQLGFLDAEDGIYRCTDCYYEIWGGICSGCERAYAGHLHLDEEEDDDEAIPSDLDFWPIGGGWDGPPEDDEISVGVNGDDDDDIWLEPEEDGEEAGDYLEDIDEALDRLADEYEAEVHAASLFERETGIYRYVDEGDEEDDYGTSGNDIEPDSDDQEDNNSEDPQENFATESESEPDLATNHGLLQVRRSTARRVLLDSDDDEPENVPIESESDPGVQLGQRTVQEDDESDPDDPEQQVLWYAAHLQPTPRGHQEDQESETDGPPLRRFGQQLGRGTRVQSAGSGLDGIPVVRRSRRVPVQDSDSDSYYSY